jgi:hypothetical protein
MPGLKNPRHERFAQLLASGKTAKAAYEIAGYKPSESNGAWLARKEEISSRLAEINNETLERERKTAVVAAERAVITRQGLIAKAEEIRDLALEAKQFSAASAAHKEVGVLSGLRIERREQGMPGEFSWLERLSIEELQLLAAGKLDIASYCKTEQDEDRPRLN